MIRTKTNKIPLVVSKNTLRELILHQHLQYNFMSFGNNMKINYPVIRLLHLLFPFIQMSIVNSRKNYFQKAAVERLRE